MIKKTNMQTVSANITEDINEEVNKTVELAIQDAIFDASKKYLRNISVDFTVSVK